jgi:hypothetical protein
LGFQIHTKKRARREPEITLLEKKRTGKKVTGSLQEDARVLAIVVTCSLWRLPHLDLAAAGEENVHDHAPIVVDDHLAFYDILLRKLFDNQQGVQVAY